MKAKELLTTKSKVDYLYSDVDVEEAVSKMDKHRFQMVPVLERGSSRYLYSISAADLLRAFLKDQEHAKTLAQPLSSIPVERLVLAVDSDAEIEDVLDLAANQNFIPLVDRSGVFQGIITRKSILSFLLKKKEK